jgi:two-component system, LytTR family, sensor kinase
MKSALPKKKLLKANWVISLFFTLFGFCTMLLARKDFDETSQVVYNSASGFVVILMICYANYFLFISLEDKLGQKKKWERIFVALSYAVSYGVFLASIFVSYLFKNNYFSFGKLVLVALISFCINSFILLFYNYVIMDDYRAYVEIEKSQLKSANAEAANQLLRRQIHPHFLFNALNILKSLYKIDQKSGEKYLIHLSNFLRASFSNNNIKVVPLHDEIRLCEDYLEMQGIRFGKALICTFEIAKESFQNGFLPSFSIQPLIENAIKHNDLTEESPLIIEIKQENDRIKVTNNLQVKENNETSTGSGLANLSERYRIICGEDLCIESDENSFSVSIKILGHENSNN